MADVYCNVSGQAMEQADLEAAASMAERAAQNHEYDHLTGHLEAGLIAENAAFACRRAGLRADFLAWAALAELAFASLELEVLTDVPAVLAWAA